MEVNINPTKIVLWLFGLIVSISMSFGTYFINNINTQLSDINTTVKSITEDIHGIELTLNKTTYTEQAFLDKLKGLKEKVTKLEESSP